MDAGLFVLQVAKSSRSFSWSATLLRFTIRLLPPIFRECEFTTQEKNASARRGGGTGEKGEWLRERAKNQDDGTSRGWKDAARGTSGEVASG